MYPRTAMSSQRRINSSRANGAKSRGPVTPEGKRKSSANSVRHGLLAQCIVLEDETSELFFELLADLTREHNPQTETQRILVETMAIARWRLMRLWTYEREIIEAEVGRTPPGTHGPAAQAGLAFRSLAENGRVLDLLNRYESRLDRQYARALNLLMKLASPESPLTQFHSGIGLPACPAAEGGSPHPSAEPKPNVEPAPPLTQSHQTTPIPLTDTSRTGLPAGPVAEGGSPRASIEPQPAPKPATQPSPSHITPPANPNAA